MSLMGLITGGWTDIAKSQQEKSAMDKANKAQQAAAANQLALEKEQRDYSRRLSEPFYNLGMPAYLQYVSAITGKPVTADQYQYDPNYTKVDGAANTYKDAAGNTVTGTPQTYTFNPQNTTAYQWQQQQLDKQMSRKLSALGRSNSTYGMNSMNDAYSDLNAREYNAQLGRLADLTNIARGGASSLTNSGSEYATNSANIYGRTGDNQANYLLALGALKSRGMGEFDSGLGQAAGIVGSLYGGGILGGKQVTNGGGGNGTSAYSPGYGMAPYKTAPAYSWGGGY